MWSEEEDETLLRCRDRQLLEWDAIADRLPGRNGKMCYSRYKRLKYNTRALWRHKDNEKLLKLVGELG
jgi:hypothetical protein